jgi:hypothetical protein
MGAFLSGYGRHHGAIATKIKSHRSQVLAMELFRG